MGVSGFHFAMGWGRQISAMAVCRGEQLMTRLKAVLHRLDAAHVYRLALEKGASGARYHAVAKEGVPLREIAEAIGRGLKMPVVSKSPEEAAKHFGWLGHFVGSDLLVKRADAAMAGMAPDANIAGNDRGSRRSPLFRGLSRLRA